MDNQQLIINLYTYMSNQQCHIYVTRGSERVHQNPFKINIYNKKSSRNLFFSLRIIQT